MSNPTLYLQEPYWSLTQEALGQNTLISKGNDNECPLSTQTFISHTFLAHRGVSSLHIWTTASRPLPLLTDQCPRPPTVPESGPKRSWQSSPSSSRKLWCSHIWPCSQSRPGKHNFRVGKESGESCKKKQTGDHRLSEKEKQREDGCPVSSGFNYSCFQFWKSKKQVRPWGPAGCSCVLSMYV